jgi:hypothetical protein
MKSVYERSIDVCPQGQNDGDDKNAEWLSQRSKCWVTGTTCSPIIKWYSTTHPWRNSRKLVRDVLKEIIFGYKQPFSAMVENILAIGRKGEPVALQMLQAELDAEGKGHTMIFPGLLVSTHNEKWGGSPDAIIVDRDGNFVTLVEVKTLSVRQIKTDDQGVAVFPSEYYAQTHFYMWLTGIRDGMGLQYVPDKLDENGVVIEQGRIYKTPIPFDDLNFGVMFNALEAFTLHVAELTEKITTGLGVVGVPFEREVTKTKEPADFMVDNYHALLVDVAEQQRRFEESVKKVEAMGELMTLIDKEMAKPIPRPGARKRHFKDVAGDLDDEEREVLAKYLD